MDFKKPKMLSKKAAERETLIGECVGHIRAHKPEEGLVRLQKLLEDHGDRLEVRTFALEAFLQLDRTEDAFREMAIVLALEPEYFAVHYHLAKDAAQKGESALAKAILDAAWKVRRKGLSKKAASKAKASHYAVLEKPEPPAEAAED